MSSALSARCEISDPIAIRALDAIRLRARDATLTRATVAADLGIAESTLAHHLKRATGRSFFEHLGRERVNLVETALLERSRPVRALALDAGFSNAAMCNHWFGKVHGVPPLVWLAQHCNRAS